MVANRLELYFAEIDAAHETELNLDLVAMECHETMSTEQPIPHVFALGLFGVMMFVLGVIFGKSL
jgi:hypothetical protein